MSDQAETIATETTQGVATPTETTPAQPTTTPSGATSTTLTGDAPGAAPKEGEAATETAVETPPVDLAKLTFPEGFDKPNEVLLGRFGEVAKSLKLSQEGAQQLTDLYTDTIKAASEANSQAWKVTIDAWENEIKNDPAIGGDKLKAIQTNFHKVLSDPRFNTPGVVEALMLTGAGSNPAINRFMAKIVNALTEGVAVEGSPGSSRSAPRSAAQALYPNLPSSETGA